MIETFLEMTASIVKSGEKLEIMKFSDDSFTSIGVKYRSSSDDIDWVTTACYSDQDDKPWVSVRTENFARRLAVELIPAKKPYLIKNIFDKFGPGIDGEIEVGDSPILLKDGDEEIVSDIMIGS